MKTLKVKFNIKEGDLQEKLFSELEDALLKHQGIQYEIIPEEQNIIVMIAKGENDNTLKDFANEGKLLKEIGIKHNVFTINNYLSFFSIEEIVSNLAKKEPSADELSKLLYKVPEDDKKVLDVLKQIKEKAKK